MKLYTHEILAQIESAQGTNAKIAILESEQANVELKTLINLALNPHIQFYIRRIPEVTTEKYAGTMTLMTAMKRLDNFSSRNFTGNRAYDELQKILEALAPEDRPALIKIIQKDLDMGVARGSVNKAWPGFISEFPVMLCQAYSEKAIANIPFPAVAQEKCDGMRIAFIVKGGKVDVRSRNGKALELLGQMDQEILKLANGQDMVIDGELLVVDMNGKILSRKEGNGILNKAGKATISEEEASRVRLVAWDAIPYADWKSGKSEIDFMSRFAFVRDGIRRLKLDKIDVPATRVVQNMTEANAFYIEMLQQGKEGAILKDMNAHWEAARTKSQVKLKVEKDIDLLITGVKEGSGKYVGMAGAIEGKSADGLLEVSVGTGLSDKQRKEYWENDPTGKIMTVKANDIITAQGRTIKSLFLPVFIEVRDDKDVADDLMKIIDEFRIYEAKK